MPGGWGGSVRRAVVRCVFLLVVRGSSCGAGSGESSSSQMARFQVHIVSAAFWCLVVLVQDCRESSKSWAFSCMRRTLRYQ
jgi:hypothetical protein